MFLRKLSEDVRKSGRFIIQRMFFIPFLAVLLAVEYGSSGKCMELETKILIMKTGKIIELFFKGLL